MKCELPCEELLKVSSLLPINLPFSSENVYLLSSETCVWPSKFPAFQNLGQKGHNSDDLNVNS